MTILTYRPGRPRQRWSVTALSFALEIAASDRVRNRSVDVTRRSWELIDTTGDFEVWLIDWPPRGAINLHDHGDSLGAVVVTCGELIETRVSVRADGRVDTRTARMRAGAFTEIGQGVIHDVENTGARSATSVHVYSPQLTSMTYFRIEHGRLVVDRAETYDTLEP